MTAAASEPLEYLHDAAVVNIVYRMDDDNRRDMIVSVICDPEAGYPKWDGKRVVIRLRDLVLASHFVVGAMTEPEQVDSWGSRLTPSMRAEAERLRSSGIPTEGPSFCVTFHSGSILEGICRCIVVDVVEAQEQSRP